MSSNIKAISDVDLSAQDVVDLVTAVYEPIAHTSVSVSDANIIYLTFRDRANQKLRQMQVGVDGTFSGDDANCEGLSKDFKSKVSFSLGDNGDAENIMREILSAIGGYYVDEHDNASPVPKTKNVLDLHEDAMLLRRADVWAKKTASTLDVPDAAVEEIIGKLQEVYIEAKSFRPAPEAPKPESPEM